MEADEQIPKDYFGRHAENRFFPHKWFVTMFVGYTKRQKKGLYPTFVEYVCVCVSKV